MKQLLDRAKDFAEKMLKTGFFSVFFSSVVCKVLTFIGGMVIVRLLSKNDYGVYTYINNCYGMLQLLNDFGCNVAAMQLCNENVHRKDRMNSYFVYGFRRGMAFSGITALLLLCSPLFYPFQEAESARLTQMLCLMPFFTTANNFLLTNLRVRLENNKYGLINVFNTLVQYVAIIPMAVWLGVPGAVFSNYAVGISVLLYSLWVSRKHLAYDWNRVELEPKERKFFLKFAFASQLNNGIDRALALLSVFLIGIFVGENTTISSYKVATTIPSALTFIPMSVMVYLVPYFTRNMQDIAWVRKNYFRLTLASMAGNGLIALVCIAVGPWLIPLLFGAQYTDAVSCYAILIVGYFFSAAFRIPTANVIYTQRKVKVNIAITTVAGVLTCLLNVVLILDYGSLGAAWATTLVNIINGLLSFGYMCIYLRRRPNEKTAA